MIHKRKSDQRLDTLYATLPTIECKGLCQKSCGPIELTQDENRRIKEKSGSDISVDEEFTCTMLKEGRCTVYDVRPAICRMFGVSEGLECPYGCKPSRYLSREEGFRFLNKIMKATGNKEPIRTSEVVFDMLKQLWNERMSK